MKDFILREEAIHYAAAFLERYEEKNPTRNHRDTMKQLRECSNYLLDNLYQPMYLSVLRHERDKK